MVGTPPADDDNVFWVQRTGVEVQIDTGPAGTPPFTVEGDEPGTRLDADDAEAATEQINRLLDAVAGAEQPTAHRHASAPDSGMVGRSQSPSARHDSAFR
jgi:hypothetical protein